ncbi:MAG TPA: hypothetical protein VHE99_07275 [Gammaproteobacteria bacterium]|nr:hypothetical protein [Gammaproteobacteria bacterium]
MLMRLLQHRFADIPENYLTLIQQTDSETLLLWAERVLDVDSLEEVFD